MRPSRAFHTWSPSAAGPHRSVASSRALSLGRVVCPQIPSSRSRSARRVGVVEMRAGSDEAQHVVHGGRVVAVAAPGAVEFKPAGVVIQTGQDDVPPELGVACRDSPRQPPPGVVALAGRFVPFIVFPDVETVGKLGSGPGPAGPCPPLGAGMCMAQSFVNRRTVPRGFRSPTYPSGPEAVNSFCVGRAVPTPQRGSASLLMGGACASSRPAPALLSLSVRTIRLLRAGASGRAAGEGPSLLVRWPPPGSPCVRAFFVALIQRRLARDCLLRRSRLLQSSGRRLGQAAVRVDLSPARKPGLRG